MRHKILKLKLKLACLVIFLAGTSLFSQAQVKLTIEQALDIAEENNPDIKSSKLSYERTQYLLEASRIALKPQFSMSVNPFSYSQRRTFDSYQSAWYTTKNVASNGTFRTELPILLTDGTLSLSDRFGWQNDESTTSIGKKITERFTNEIQLRYAQPIFTYNRRKMEMERLEFDHENSGINYALQRLRTEQSITSQFYSLYSAQNSLDISRAELENSQQNYKIISAKVEADLSAREELYQAEVNLSNAESSVESATVSLNNAKDALKRTLGMPMSEEIDVLADIKVLPILIDPEKAIQVGLASRMELRQREINIASSDMELIRVKASNEFSGNVSLALGITADDRYLGNIYDNPTQSPSISISFNVPIFDWGQRKARIHAQEAAQTIAQLDYANLKVDIEVAIRQSLRNLANLSTQISIAEKSVRNTELTYELNQVRYREGNVTGLQMSQYQAQLSNARSSYITAQIRYKNELLSLKILTLYDFENDKPIIPIRSLSSITMR